jgi:hypothetical protein
VRNRARAELKDGLREEGTLTRISFLLGRPIHRASQSNKMAMHPMGMTAAAIALFPLAGPVSTPGAHLVARRDRGAALPDRKQSIEAYRISDADNVTGRVVVEPHGHVKVHLLGWSEAIQPARIQ